MRIFSIVALALVLSLLSFSCFAYATRDLSTNIHRYVAAVQGVSK